MTDENIQWHLDFVCRHFYAFCFVYSLMVNRFSGLIHAAVIMHSHSVP